MNIQCVGSKVVEKIYIMKYTNNLTYIRKHSVLTKGLGYVIIRVLKIEPKNCLNLYTHTTINLP